MYILLFKKTTDLKTDLETDWKRTWKRTWKLKKYILRKKVVLCFVFSDYYTLYPWVPIYVCKLWKFYFLVIVTREAQTWVPKIYMGIYVFIKILQNFWKILVRKYVIFYQHFQLFFKTSEKMESIFLFVS